jgi:hypothetical protein
MLGPNSPGATAVNLYNPKTNTWRVGADAPGGLVFPYLAWTGTDLIVWSEGRGGLYNPSANSWRELPPVTVVSMMPGSRGKWIPDPGVLAVQGNLAAGSSDVRNTGVALFDPKTNEWTGPFAPPAPLSAQAEGAVVGSKEIFASEGSEPSLVFDARTRTWETIKSGSAGGGPGYFVGIPIGDGKVAIRTGSESTPLEFVDTKTGERTHAAAPGAMPAGDGATIWTGKEMLLWGQPPTISPTMHVRAWRWRPSD